MAEGVAEGGLVRVLLISANRHDRYLGSLAMRPAPIGLAYLAAGLDTACHPVRVVDLMFAADPGRAVEEAVAAFDPGLVGIALRQADNQAPSRPASFLPLAREIVARCRTLSKAPIVVGGQGFSLLPKPCFEYLDPDFGIVGDADDVFPLLVEAIGGGQECGHLPGIVHRHHSMVRANPWRSFSNYRRPPRLDLLDLAPYRAEGYGLGVVARMHDFPRPHDPPAIRQAAAGLRVRPPAAVVDEMAALRAAHGFDRFFLLDPAFGEPVDHALALCAELERRHLQVSWATTLSPGELRPEVAAAMHRAGCALAVLGGVGPMQDRLSDFDGHLAALARTCRALAAGEVPFALSLIFGRPGETRETVERALALAERSGADHVILVGGVRILPHTPLAERAIAEGRIAAHDDLLFPVFYVANGVAPWLADRLAAAAAGRAGWHLA
jgi:hypothetical protein